MRNKIVEPVIHPPLTAEQQALFEIRSVRQSQKERRTPDRILQFEEGLTIKTVTYNETDKETSMQSPDEPEHTVTEPITIDEKKSLDAMLDLVEAYENGEFVEPGHDDFDNEPNDFSNDDWELVR
jgi:hypothetical protein